MSILKLAQDILTFGNVGKSDQQVEVPRPRPMKKTGPGTKSHVTLVVSDRHYNR